MSGLGTGTGLEIRTEIEGAWTWVYGETYPIKEELKGQGFSWSMRRRAWYKRSIVDVNAILAKEPNGGKKEPNGGGEKEKVRRTRSTKEKERIVETGAKEIEEAHKEELSEHDRALIEGNYKIEGIHERELIPTEETKEEINGYESIGEIDSIVMKDVAGFVNRIEPGNISELEVGKKGWHVYFANFAHTLAGKVEISKDAWIRYWDTNDMELTFDASRVKNMFATMKKGEVAEIGFDEYNMIAVWSDLNLTWTHKLIDTDYKIVKPPHVKELNYPVVLTLIGQPTIAGLRKMLKEAKKGIDKYETWEGVMLRYREDNDLPVFGVYAYKFEYKEINGKWTHVPEVKPILELSGDQFDLDPDKREQSTGIYTFENFEHMLKGAKGKSLTIAFGDGIPLKASFEIRQGVKVVAYQASASLDEEEKEKLTSLKLK